MNRIYLTVIGLFMLAVGCSRNNTQYGQIYESHQGTNDAYYARSYSKGGFWYWMSSMGGGSSSSGFSSDHNSGSSGGWSLVPAKSVPSDLKPTDKVVKEKEGEPTEDVAEKSTVSSDEVVTEATTSEQESEMEAKF
jgi:hypothetical protein